MINYEKLKQRVETAIDSCNGYSSSSSNSASLMVFAYESVLKWMNEFDELARYKAKYKVKEVAWVVGDDSPLEIYIEEIDLNSDEMYLDSSNNWWCEDDLYPTRQALIEAQIKYWINLADDSAVELLCNIVGDNAQERFDERTKSLDEALAKKYCARPDDTHKKADECVHENDGMRYREGTLLPGHYFEAADNTPKEDIFFKCIKCKELYR